MKPSSPSPFIPDMKQPSINPLGLTLIVVFLAFVSMVLLQRFGNVEEQREMLHWQNKLSIIADSRTADIDGWLDRHFRELEEVATNPSLQLYFTTLMSPKAQESALPPGLAEEPAQTVFLRNLLVLTADRLSFTTKTSDDLKTIRANVSRVSGTGLAILGMDGKMMVSTQGLGGFDDALAEKIAQTPRGKNAFIDLFHDASGAARIGFVLPVYPIQSDKKPEEQIGRLVGIKSVGPDLLRLLTQPGLSDKTFESVLLRRDNENVETIAVQAGGEKEPVKKTPAPLALSTPELDAAFAVTHPGTFAVKRDAQSNLVLMTSRKLTHAPWVLLLHIDRDQALQESDNWRSNMKFSMACALLALICGIVAAWWYGSSRRATLLSQQTAKLAAYSMAQERMLRVVSDNQPEPIFIADTRKLIHFANVKTAERFKIKVNDIIGKSMAGLMGADLARTYAEANETALSSHQTLTRTHRVGGGLEARTYSSTHVPLEHIPLEGLQYPTPGVLVVDEDVTAVVTEKERRERILHQLINTLVRLVDARDPYSSNHSQAVSITAREVAQSLGLSPVLTETARIAGKIMNIGKVMVPSEILTRKRTLEGDELQIVREGLSRSVALLQGIEFDGPVVNTLRQSAERVDGTGPLGLKGEEILITARIIAAANSFVGMISPRAYRNALSVELATGTLLQNVDTQFDRKVVVALINFVENKKGREALLKLVEQKAA